MSSTDGRAPVSTLRDVFAREVLTAQKRVAARQNVYVSGDADDSMYLMESGQVKLLMSSADGTVCVVAIYTAGDVFGESCFSASPKRFESATAILPTIVHRIARRDFLAQVWKADAMETLLRHIAGRMAERQTAVFDFATMDAEHRLMKFLLQFAEKLGTPNGPYLTAERLPPQEDLSQIVGTTRPRVTKLMQGFRRLGIIATRGRTLTIHRTLAWKYLQGTR